MSLVGRVWGAFSSGLLFSSLGLLGCLLLTFLFFFGLAVFFVWIPTGEFPDLVPVLGLFDVGVWFRIWVFCVFCSSGYYFLSGKEVSS